MGCPLFLLAILTIATSGTLCQFLPRAQHVCNGTNTEQAGLSGSIEFRDKCDLTLRNFTLLRSKETRRYSIPGVSTQDNCGGAAELTINTKSYCVNESVRDTLVELDGDETRFILKSAEPESFTLSYYKVFIDDINGDEDEPLYLEGVMSSIKYPEQPPLDLEFIEIQCESFPDELYMTFTLLSPQAQLAPDHLLYVTGRHPSGYINGASINAKQNVASSIRCIKSNGEFSLTESATRPIFLVKFEAVICDVNAIPHVTAASYALNYSNSYNLALPGKVNVIYKCNDGYELLNPENNSVWCVTSVKKDYFDGSFALLVAEWSSAVGIKCQRDDICDVKAIPDLTGASYTLHYSKGYNLTLPGNVNVTYKCDEGYELSNAEKNTVVCATVRQAKDAVDVKPKPEWSSIDGIECQRVAICDVKAIPDLTGASYTLHYSKGYNLTLPGKVNVTYKCNNGSELANPEKNTIVCATKVQTRDADDANLMAVWSATNDIKCQRVAKGERKRYTAPIVVSVIVVIAVIAAAVILVAKKNQSTVAAAPLAKPTPLVEVNYSSGTKQTSAKLVIRGEEKKRKKKKKNLEAPLELVHL